jgi:hypothetical protein
MIVPSVQFTFESFDSKLETHSVSPYEEEEKKLNALLNKLNNKKLIGEGKLLEIIKKLILKNLNKLKVLIFNLKTQTVL